MKEWDYTYLPGGPCEGTTLFSHPDYDNDRKSKDVIEEEFKEFCKRCERDSNGTESVEDVACRFVQIEYEVSNN